MTTVRERFEAKYEPDPMSGCWLWTAAVDPDGYGRVPSGNGMALAHRAAWEFERGPIPTGLCVCHHCDTPACVNPSHLFLGSHADNMRDMVAKGRVGGTAAVNATKTQCVNGHAFTAANTYLREGRGRECRSCWSDRSRRYNAAKRAMQ